MLTLELILITAFSLLSASLTIIIIQKIYLKPVVSGSIKNNMVASVKNTKDGSKAKITDAQKFLNSFHKKYKNNHIYQNTKAVNFLKSLDRKIHKIDIEAAFDRYTFFERYKILLNNGQLQIKEERQAQVKYTIYESMKIINSIFHLAKTVKDQERQPIEVIGNKLLKPFLYVANLSNKSKKIISDAFELLVNVNLNATNPVKLNNEPPLLNSKKFTKLSDKEQQQLAATQIQRACRAYLYRKNVRNTSLQSIDLSIVDYDEEELNDFFDFQNPPQPKAIINITQKDKSFWANNHKIFSKNLANKIAATVCYRPHTKFLGRLKYVVDKFNQHIYSLPKDKRDYILVLHNKLEKSNTWVTALAIKYLHQPPKAILKQMDLLGYYKKFPNTQYAVYIDDAVYSGTQMSELIESDINDSNTKSSHLKKAVVILPFYQQRGLDKIKECCSLAFVGEPMLSPKQLWPHSSHRWIADDLEILDTKVKARGGITIASDKSSTFFQHRIGDYFSSFLSQDPFKQLIPDNPQKPYGYKFD